LFAELNAPAAGAPPVIAEQPQSQASYVGGAVTLAFLLSVLLKHQVELVWLKEDCHFLNQ